MQTTIITVHKHFHHYEVILNYMVTPIQKRIVKQQYLKVETISQMGWASGTKASRQLEWSLELKIGQTPHQTQWMGRIPTDKLGKSRR